MEQEKLNLFHYLTVKSWIIALPRYSRLLSTRIAQTANTNTVNNKDRLYFFPLFFSTGIDCFTHFVIPLNVTLPSTNGTHQVRWSQRRKGCGWTQHCCFALILEDKWNVIFRVVRIPLVLHHVRGRRRRHHVPVWRVVRRSVHKVIRCPNVLWRNLWPVKVFVVGFRIATNNGLLWRSCRIFFVKRNFFFRITRWTVVDDKLRPLALRRFLLSDSASFSTWVAFQQSSNLLNSESIK